MIQYDWNRVKKQADNKSKNIILIISAITWPTNMPSIAQKRINPFLNKDFFGDSFLLYPEKLLEHKYVIPNKEIVEYIALASRRSIAEYSWNGTKTLDIRLAPFIPENNRLITIENSTVHFKYE